MNSEPPTSNAPQLKVIIIDRPGGGGGGEEDELGEVSSQFVSLKV